VNNRDAAGVVVPVRLPGGGAAVEVGDELVTRAGSRVVLGEGVLDGLSPVAQLGGPGDAAGPVRGVGGVGALVARRDGVVVPGPADAVGEAVGEPGVGAGGRHVLEDLVQRVLLPVGVGDVCLI